MIKLKVFVFTINFATSITSSMLVGQKIASFLCSAQNELTINISKLNFIDAGILSQLNTLTTNYNSLEERVAALEAGGSGGGTEIVVSATQPASQETGSFWYKDLS